MDIEGDMPPPNSFEILALICCTSLRSAMFFRMTKKFKSYIFSLDGSAGEQRSSISK